MADGNELDLLMQAARAGDRVAYRRLLTLAAERLRAYFTRRLAERADAEDLVQECLIAMHARRESHDPKRPVAPWMYAIARYKLADHFRRGGRRSALPIDENMMASDQIHDANDLERLLGELPASQAEAVLLTKVHGYSAAETAAITGSGVSAVKVRIHRGLVRLKALVAEKQP